MTFITPDQLKTEMAADSKVTPLCIVDCGAKETAQADYDEKCVPGAVFLKQNKWISIKDKKWDIPDK